MVDLVRVEANERIDLIDFQFALNESLENALRDQGRGFLTNPNGVVTTWILSGFGMTNVLGKQLTVTKGRALLGYRLNGATNFGMLSLDGDATKIIDMTAFTPGTYNVYVRFEYVDTDSTSRVFWDPAGTGSEFTQTVPTRLQANWSMRVELSSPGTEWTKIGTANNAGGSLVLVDTRKFYFEGAADSAYASGWSTDGGGGANDRNASRSAYGVGDLQTFTAATRQSLEDIKGRGLRRWWDRDIGGMNIGFDANPVEDRIAVGDAAMYLQWASDYPFLQMDAGGDKITYDRAGNHWMFEIGDTEEARLGADGLAIAKGLYVGSATGVPVDNEIYAEGNITSAGGRLYLGSGTDDYEIWNGAAWLWFLDGVQEAKLSSTGFVTKSDIVTGGFFRFKDGGNDYIAFNESTNDLDFVLDGVTEWSFDSLALDCCANDIVNVGAVSALYFRAGSSLTALNSGDGLFLRGVNVGFDAVPNDNAVSVGDANFRLDFYLTNRPALYFDSNTYLEFNRADPAWDGYIFYSGGTPVASIRNDATFGKSVFCPGFVPTSSSLHNPGVSSYAHVLNINTCPYMIAVVTSIGTLSGEVNWNVASIAHTIGTGTYYITYTNPRGSNGFTAAFASTPYIGYGAIVDPFNTLSTKIETVSYLSSSLGVHTDSMFSVVVYSLY